MSGRERSARLLREAVGSSGPEEPAEHDWGHWVELARHERLVPQLYGVATRPSTLPVGLVEMAERMQLDVMSAVVRFEHDLLEVTAALEAANLAYAVLKGAATAHLDHPDPAARQFADVDLLVSPDTLVMALEVLGGVGWAQAYSLPRHHQRFTHSVTLRRDDRVEVDLHQRLAHRGLGRVIPTEVLLGRREPFEVAGRGLWALDRVDRFLHAAIHLVGSRGEYVRLSSALDVLVMASSPDLSPRDTLDRAEQWGIARLIVVAIERSFEAAALPVPSTWSEVMTGRPRSRQRLVERAYSSTRRRPVLEEVTHLSELPGWRDRADYLRGYFTTDSDYAAQHGRSGLRAQTRYLWSRLRSGRQSTSPE